MAEHEGIGHMAERRDVHIRALRRDEIDEMGIDAAIFGIRRIDCRLIVEDEDLAAFRQGQTSAIVGLDGDVPGLRAFLAPVEFGGEVDAGGVGEGEIRRNRRLPVVREGECSLCQEEGLGQNGRGDGQGINARIEDAEPAGLPDPVLARMPTPHILLPDDPNLCRTARREPFARRFDGR